VRRDLGYREAVNRKELAHLFARVSRRSPARAADIIDGLVHRLLKEFKQPFNDALKRRFTAAGSSGDKQDRP
jgi:hypothetical protein